MKSAEDMMLQWVPKADFWDACRNAFSGNSGDILRRALASISHPLTPPVGVDALETYRLIGRAEIVNLLLRYSDVTVTPGALMAIETKPE